MADAERAAATALRDVSLDDKYDLTKDRVFITGTQAIIRMLLMQRERDRRAGLITAATSSGRALRPSGTPAWSFARVSSGFRPWFTTASSIGVSTKPGCTELQRMP